MAPKPDKVTACLATRLHNYPDRESFLPGRHFFMAPPFRIPRKAGAPRTHANVPRPSLQERHAAIVTDEAVGAAASAVQVCRRTVFPERPSGAQTPSPGLRFKTWVQDLGSRLGPGLEFRTWSRLSRLRMPARCDWLMKLRAARSARPGIRYWRHAGGPSSSPPDFRLTINLLKTVARRTRRR